MTNDLKKLNLNKYEVCCKTIKDAEKCNNPKCKLRAIVFQNIRRALFKANLK